MGFVSHSSVPSTASIFIVVLTLAGATGCETFGARDLGVEPVRISDVIANRGPREVICNDAVRTRVRAT